jgi:hypothetical protein
VVVEGTCQPPWHHPHHLIQSLSLPLSKTNIFSFGDLELGLKIKILVFFRGKNFSPFMRQRTMSSPFGFTIHKFIMSFLLSKNGLCM